MEKVMNVSANQIVVIREGEGVVSTMDYKKGK